LINAVIKRKAVARVSQTPGKTQAVHFYLVNDRFYLVDLPGYGYARVPKSVMRSWGDLVRGYLDTADELRLILLLLDARRTPGEQDRQMHEWTIDCGIDEKIALTKSDKLSKQQLLKSKQTIAEGLGIDPSQVIATSAVTKTGIDEVRREMFSRL